MNNIPAGYKKTAVGVIPDDWHCSSLSNITAPGTPVTYGIVQAGPHIQNGIPYIKTGDMSGSNLPTEGLARTSPQIASRYPRSTVRTGELVYSIRASVGTIHRIPPELNGANLTQGTARISPSTSIDPEYLLNALRSSACQNWVNLRTKGTTYREIALVTLRDLPVPEALSNADALIESLEQLIAKKRQVKQASMQELLTGKTRLPGFSDDWQELPLGAMAPLQRGFDLPSTKLQEGPYPVVYSNGVLNYHAMPQVKGPGVVTGRSGTIGTVTFVKQDFWPHNTSLWVTNFRGNDPKYTFFFYTALTLERFATGSGVPTLNRNDIHALNVRIPPTLAEQQAIATILSDMDAEITALEQKLAKARQVKQGMMQELLTGRIRLV